METNFEEKKNFILTVIPQITREPITPDELELAIAKLYYWQYPNRETPPNFSSDLYNLIKKADGTNRAKLCKVFPAEFVAMHLWENSGDYGNDLFRTFGLMNEK